MNCLLESGSGSGGFLFPDISPQNNNTRCIPMRAALNANLFPDTCIQFFPEDKCFIYNYTTQFVTLRQSLIILDNALSTSPTSPYCKEVLRAYVCNYAYPGCNPFTGLPQGICTSECERYVHNECARDFNTFFQVIQDTDQNLISVSDECNNTVEFTGVMNIDSTDCFNITDDITEEPVEPMTNPPPATQPPTSQAINITLLETLIPATVVVVTLILILIGVIVFAWRTKKKHKRRSENNQIPLTSPGRRSSNFYQISIELDDNPYDDPEDAALFRFREEDVASFGDNVQLHDALLPFEQLRMTDVLGEGAFGRVHKGHFVKHLPNGTTQTILVAVKTIKSTQGEYTELKNFIEESSLMCTFNHPHVLGMVGICLDSCQSPYLILPFMEHGDLRTFLRNKREMATKSTDTGYPEGLEYEMLARICSEIASGMEYLASRKLVHRDLAARNCMVDSDISVKVGDFGLARDIYQTDYYRQNSRIKIPVKWMAPESLHDGISNEKTDVWSYGVTCWEVFSLGRVPYPTILHQDILEHLETGNRLKRPALASDVIHDLIQDCWLQDPKRRPKFSDITKRFTSTIIPDTTQELFSNNATAPDKPMTSMERTLSTSPASTRVAAVAPIEEEPLLESIISHFEKTPPASFLLDEDGPGGVANSFVQSLKGRSGSLKSFSESFVVENPYTQHNGVKSSDHMMSQRDHVTLDTNSDYYTEMNPQGALLSAHPYRKDSADRASSHVTTCLTIVNEYDEVDPDHVINSEKSRTSPSENYIQMFPASFPQ